MQDRNRTQIPLFLSTVLNDSEDEEDDVILNAIPHFISSSSEEEDDDEPLQFVEACEERRGPLVLRPRIPFYVERVVPQYSANEFKSHFRVLPETLEFILSLVGPIINPPDVTVGRKRLPARKQLLLALWSMATPDSYRSICEKFNVGRATAHRSVKRVTDALCHFAPRFVKWPEGDDAVSVMEEFERAGGFPRVIGAIDGTHIQIPAPRKDAQSYVNRKSYHSIQVQAVCTHSLLFTSVYAGHVGSVHDARVFRLSPVMGYLGNPAYFPNDSHLVGDGAYALHLNLMFPFRDNGHLSPRQKNFNFCLSSGRVSIERAFGLWEARWRSIRDCFAMTKTENIPKFVLATCVLHNICIMQRDFVEFQPGERREEREAEVNMRGQGQGHDKRLQIMYNLPMRAV